MLRSHTCIYITYVFINKSDVLKIHHKTEISKLPEILCRKWKKPTLLRQPYARMSKTIKMDFRQAFIRNVFLRY